MHIVQNSKYYVFDNPEILNQAEFFIQKQQYVLNSYQEFKAKHDADFVQYCDELSRGICFMGLIYLEVNADKIDKKLFKVSKSFFAPNPSVAPGDTNPIRVVRACSRHSYKHGLRIESLHFSYDSFANILLSDGKIVSMITPVVKAPIYVEIKGDSIAAGREIFGSEYEERYNKSLLEKSPKLCPLYKLTTTH